MESKLQERHIELYTAYRPTGTGKSIRRATKLGPIYSGYQNMSYNYRPIVYVHDTGPAIYADYIRLERLCQLELPTLAFRRSVYIYMPI